MSILSTAVSGTLLLATESRDFLCSYYYFTPLNLQIHCNWYGTASNICHTLIWIRRGQVIARHNVVHENLLCLARRAFTSSSVRARPLIHQGHTRSERDIRQGGDKYKETRGDVMIPVSCNLKTDVIIDVKLGNSDADCYKYEQMAALLAWWESVNKDNHGKHCQNQQKHFSTFLLSIVCMLGREALVIIEKSSQTMAAKMDKLILHIQGWING